ADTAVDITNSATPLLINGTGKTTLINTLTNNYKIAINIGTTMFYGVHKALANLKSNEANYPVNLDSVHIITFTDGLDLSSRGVLMQAGNSIEGVTMASNVDYAAYIKDQINTRTINDVPIKAYSIGVRGTDLDQSDPGQVSMFYNNLESVASPNESYVFDDFSEVKIVFDDIKKGLNTSSTSTSFIMVSTLFDSGTKIRMTFDVDSNISAAGAASQRYIDATMQELTDGTRMLVDIEYSPGISSDAGAGPIFGAISGTEVTFVFNNINGYDASIDQTNTRQWVINPGFTSWVHNSEYKNNNSSATTIEKSSILIYLVLDCSTSLSENDISIIRTTAIDFINSLDQ
ncbi:MAG: hypothetical protein LBI04_10230, partial [Treponema sp.]|nr:hypothetical protein [Treponema sp.]